MKNLAHIFKKFEFGAPVVAAVLVVALTGVTVLAGPGAAPPAGVVNAKFSTVATTNLYLSNFGISNPNMGNGGAVKIADAEGLLTDGPITAGGHLKASGGIGDFFDSGGNDVVLENGETKWATVSCVQPGAEVVSCQGWWKNNAVPGRIAKFVDGSLTGIMGANETSCYYQLFNDTGAQRIFQPIALCFRADG